MTPSPTRWTVMTLGAALALLAGCAGSKSQTAAPGVVSPDVAPDPVTQSQLRESALEHLAEMAASPDAQSRANAIEGMLPARGRLEPLVARALEDPNLGVRSVAAMMVGRARLEHLTPNVRPLLSDPSPFVRAAAIFALAANESPVDETPLAGMLLRDPSTRVRRHVADILGLLGEPSALGLLRDAARATLPREDQGELKLLQLQLAEAMVRLGEEKQIETIRAALYPSRPEDLESTALAVQILGELEDKGSMDNLIYLSAAKDVAGQMMPAEVRLAAAASLARLGLTQGAFIADEYATDGSPAIRAQVAFVYGRTGRPENLPRLRAMLEDPNPLVRIAAAAGIVRITSAPAH